MMTSEHISLLIAAASKRDDITCVDHLARRADQSVAHWRQLAQHLCDLGYAETYDDCETIDVTDDGFHEAQRLVAEKRGQASQAATEASTVSTVPLTDSRCHRCQTALRHSARFCFHCGTSIRRS